MQEHPEQIEREVSELYERTCPRLIGILAAMSGSRSDAEEVAQEAYLRAFSRWAEVRLLDSPEAWVRLVAMRLLISRHRRLARGFSLHRLMRSRDDANPTSPTPDRLAVELALAQTPLDHRVVVVLHYVLDLSVDEIARELVIPAGTVKSRLSRARKNLAPLLNDRSETSRHAG